jgi:hypothetical protein
MSSNYTTVWINASASSTSTTYLNWSNFDTSGLTNNTAPAVKYWKSKDGTLYNVAKMADQHLQNTLNMLWRNHFVSSKEREVLKKHIRGLHRDGTSRAFAMEVLRGSMYSAYADNVFHEAEKRGMVVTSLEPPKSRKPAKEG